MKRLYTLFMMTILATPALFGMDAPSLSELNDSWWQKEGNDTLNELFTTLPQAELNQRLIDATGQNQPFLVKVLVKAGANPNAKNELGLTAIMHFAQNLNQDMVSFLILHKADWQLRDNFGINAKAYWNHASYLTLPKEKRLKINAWIQAQKNISGNTQQIDAHK